MKATGIVRRIDDLGRVVIPKEIRRTMRIKEGDPLEIYTDRDGEVIFKKYSPIGEMQEFAARYAEAASKGLRQRFVASLVKDSSAPFGYRAKIGLESIDSTHPLFNLCGTDNAALIQTDFYPSPLVVQGAGAGAYQTASGVLNDIIM